MNNKPEKIALKEGVKFTITAAITDAAVFNHYILKEYAPRVQGSLAFSKNPAKHTLENCLYDELSGWLDMPTITGLAILDIQATSDGFKNTVIHQDPKICLSDIVDLLYNICKLNSVCKNNSTVCSVDKQHLQELKDKAKIILQIIDKVNLNGETLNKKSGPKMGNSVCQRTLSN